jgi:hypothetical protein
MLCAYLKIAVLLTVPAVTLSYSGQVRHASDIRQAQSIVRSSLDLNWMVNHPRESLERGQNERRRVAGLIEDLDQ